jgi:hypothetical protein
MFVDVIGKVKDVTVENKVTIAGHGVQLHLVETDAKGRGRGHGRSYWDSCGTNSCRGVGSLMLVAQQVDLKQGKKMAEQKETTR